MKFFSFLLGIFISLSVFGQQVSFTVAGYDVQYGISGDSGFSAFFHLDPEGNADGPVKVFKIKNADTVFIFRGKAEKGFLSDSASWFTEEGLPLRRAYFLLPANIPKDVSFESTDFDDGKLGLPMKGILNGEEIRWRTDWYTDVHFMCSISNYIFGKKQGSFIEYNVTGQVEEKGNYEADERIGSWDFFREGKICQRNFYSGKLDSMYLFSEAGALIEKAVYLPNRFENHFIYDNGLRSTYEALDGEKHGSEITYHPNGSKASVLTYRYGAAEGKFESWYDNGKPFQQFTYVKGKRHGAYQSFYPNGKAKAKGNYSNGSRTGTWEHYFPNGKVVEPPTKEMEAEEKEQVLIEYVNEMPVMETIPGFVDLPDAEYFPVDQNAVIKTGFLKKYPRVELTVSLDTYGKMSYTIDTPMDEKFQKKLVDFLGSKGVNRLPLKISGRPIPCKVHVIMESKTTSGKK